MRHDQFALDDAVGIQLTLDTHGLIPGKAQVCGEMQALLGDVHDLAEGGRARFRHKAAPRNRLRKCWRWVVIHPSF